MINKFNLQEYQGDSEIKNNNAATSNNGNPARIVAQNTPKQPKTSIKRNNIKPLTKLSPKTAKRQ